VRPHRPAFANGKTRLLIVVDVRLHRERLISDLTCRGEYEVAGSSVEEVLSRVASMQPAIVVLDMVAPGGIEIARAIAAQDPGVKTVAFAIGDSEQEILACVDAGVAGYVSRDASLDDLVAAIESVVRGDLPVPPRIAAALFRGLADVRKDERQTFSGILTARERQILLLINEGLSNKEIAVRLSIEVATVKNHVHSLLTKMQVGSRGQAAARLSGPGFPRLKRNGADDPTRFIA
jgi:two-component system nitrate/nitrite response regulator NarL